MEIFTKEVDKSLLKEGISIPAKYQKKLMDALNIRLDFGEQMDIAIEIEGQRYRAILKNQRYDKEKYLNHVPVIQIRYSPKGALACRLRDIFSSTLEYVQEGINKDSISNSEKEYVRILISKEENTLQFQCIRSLSSREQSYKNIEFLSQIMEKRDYLLHEMDGLLEEFYDQENDFLRLMQYLNSEQRQKDIEEEKVISIPTMINRKVLSEEETKEFLEDNHNVMLRMIETAIESLKTKL